MFNMEDTLTYIQIEEIKQKMQKEIFNLEYEMSLLVNLGFEKSKAIELLLLVEKSYREDLFYEIKEKNEIEEKGNIAFGAILIFSMFVSIMGNNNGFLIVVSVLAACFAGYFGFPNKPIAGLFGFATGAILMPIVTSYYLQGRESFIIIEFIIPVLLSFGPGLLVKYLISKMMYSSED